MGAALGILVPEFPQQTHAFFWREIVALREMGVDVALFSTKRPDPDACRHAFAAQARAEARYLYPPRIPAALQVLATSPVGAVQAARYVAGLSESSLSRKARALALGACAADLVHHARSRGISHVHAHSCAEAAHVVALARLLGGPTYSLTLHGDLPVYGTDHRSKVAGATCMTCAGPHLKTQLIEKIGYPPERILPNWMGVDTSHFIPSETNDLGTAGRLKMLTVARLSRAKGHVHALRAQRVAVDQGCDVTYSIAGEGPFRQEIEAEVARLGLGDRVSMLGTRSEAEVLGLMRSHDVFVLSSVGLGEAGPVSLMEAMSVGMPSIVSRIGSTSHMVQDGVNAFLIDQGDEGALAKALVSLCREPHARQQIGVAARRRAIEEFDTRLTARRLLEFIEENLGQRFGRA